MPGYMPCEVAIYKHQCWLAATFDLLAEAPAHGYSDAILMTKLTVEAFDKHTSILILINRVTTWLRDVFCEVELTKIQRASSCRSIQGNGHAHHQ